MYLQLQLFEKNLDYFYSYIIRIICLEKEYYKICENKFHLYLHGIDNNLYNTFVTLKSIESFQIDLEEYFKMYDAYIDAFKSGFDVNMNINHDHNKPYLLQFYLKKLNDYNKKKVKHPHC